MPGGTSYTYDSRYMTIDGSVPAVIANTNPPIRTRGFFPIDEFPPTGSTGGGDLHDFHFTSEVRFWFEYQANSPSLDFSGDDDVWVYVNGHLALDIGGIHGRVAKSFTIDAANATAFGLETGKVYEIAVFQAERNISQSNYWLTLEGFNAARSACKSTCGDGKIASDELCDDGPDNTTTSPPPYGKCSADCKTRGPHCGDGKADAGVEECDDGVNTSVYDFSGKGCAPGCVKPPRCGDAKIQAPPEQCDDGKNDGAYGGCTSACRLAERCGDKIVQTQFGEECDDGPAGSANCAPFCQIKGPH
jgi:fibro-slime domain-containing protein